MSLDEVKERLENHEKRISRLERLLTETKPGTAEKKLSIKEFILQKRPKNDVQKALAVGYFLEKHEEFASFNARDLEKGFRDAREKIPQNVADKIQKNIDKGYMMEMGEKKDDIKAYVLTNSGEQFVEENFEE